MKTLEFRALIDPAICDPRHSDFLEFIRSGFQPVPDLVRAGKPALFVHPKLQLCSYHDQTAAIEEIGKNGLGRESVERLVRIDVTMLPVKDILAALQALLVRLATFYLTSDGSDRANEDIYFHVLYIWTQTLLAVAQPRKPQSLAPWQEWLFGESVRRTIIMSYAFAMAISGFKNGYCSNWLFLESLPLDSRAGLWMAESPQAWIAAAGARNGEEVGERLSSFHEFAEVLNAAHANLCGDKFLALLAYSHTGVHMKN
jgi:hypothetical protein